MFTTGILESQPMPLFVATKGKGLQFLGSLNPSILCKTYGIMLPIINPPRILRLTLTFAVDSPSSWRQREYLYHRGARWVRRSPSRLCCWGRWAREPCSPVQTSTFAHRACFRRGPWRGQSVQVSRSHRVWLTRVSWPSLFIIPISIAVLEGMPGVTYYIEQRPTKEAEPPVSVWWSPLKKPYLMKVSESFDSSFLFQFPSFRMQKFRFGSSSEFGWIESNFHVKL